MTLGQALLTGALAQQGRGATDRGQYRQAAGAAAQVNVTNNAKPSSRRFPPPWSVAYAYAMRSAKGPPSCWEPVRVNFWSSRADVNFFGHQLAHVNFWSVHLLSRHKTHQPADVNFWS